MKDHIAITYLCYVNDSNKKRRYDNFTKSLKSMSLFEDQKGCTVYAIDNNCSPSIGNEVKRQAGIDHYISMNKNFFDIGSVYSCARIAKNNNFKYCCYMFDDFVVYNNSFIEDSINFMNEHSDVGCLRIPAYSFNEMTKFDCMITPKSVNPDAVRHYSNNHVKNSALLWEGPYDYSTCRFYKNNWHYSSRPAIWRTETLLSFFENEIPVMQKFENFAAKKFFKTGLKTGVLDGGAMYTFLESERTSGGTSSLGNDIKIKISEMNDILDKA